MQDNSSDATRYLAPLVLEKGFSVQFRGDHVHVQLGPDYKTDPDRRVDFWSKIKALCDEHGSRRVLVEGLVPGGEHETGDVVDAGLRTATVPNLWLAFHLTDFVPNDRSELFEAVAASRGVRVKFFSDRERALKWLRQNSPR